MKKNNGFTLLEVLISMLLLMVIGLGSAYLLARANVTQRGMNIHLLTVSQMRNALQNNDICPTSLTSTTKSVDLKINSNMNTTVTCKSTGMTSYNVTATGLSDSNVTVSSQTVAESSSASNPITISP